METDSVDERAKPCKKCLICCVGCLVNCFCCCLRLVSKHSSGIQAESGYNKSISAVIVLVTVKCC